jgi:kanamycin kinase
MAWAAPFTPVPRPLVQGSDTLGSWLVTEALPGESAVSPQWTGRPAVAARAIGEGLRALHDALPVPDCPFTWSLEERRGRILDLAASQGLDPAGWHPDHAGLDASRALALLADAPPVDRLVVCHGDPCAPNTLIGADGRWSGHVDLGRLGVADRWADLAVATWSLDWNYGPGWSGELLSAYGIVDDPARTRWYRLLWDLAP